MEGSNANNYAYQQQWEQLTWNEADFQCMKHILFIEEELLDWKKRLPIGYRFIPTDHELIKHYLLKKLNGGFILPGIIQDADIYQCHPANFPGVNNGEDICYYFTPRDQMFENSKRATRTTKDGKGRWKMTSKRNPLCEIDGSKLGEKNALVYHIFKPGQDKDFKTNWIMHEYVLDKSLYNPSQVASTSSAQPKQTVLCRIYERKKRRAEEDQESPTEWGEGIEIKDTDDNSAKFNKNANGTKISEQPSISKRGKSSQKSVEEVRGSEVGETSSCSGGVEQLPFSQQKRFRPSPTEGDACMCLSNCINTCNCFQLSQISPQQPPKLWGEFGSFLYPPQAAEWVEDLKGARGI